MIYYYIKRYIAIKRILILFSLDIDNIIINKYIIILIL